MHKILFSACGLVVGIIIGLWLSLLLFRSKSNHVTASGSGSLPSSWHWPDSLDAVVAAPNNHKILFENDAVRILEVTLDPYENEPMHTHRLPSVMFGGHLNDTASFDIVYYKYDYDSVAGRYVVKDSFPQHQSAGHASEDDKGHFMKPELPHSIKNRSNVKIDVYRVEFKYPAVQLK